MASSATLSPRRCDPGRTKIQPIQPAHSSCTDSASWQVSFHNPKAEFGNLSVLIRRTEQTVLRFRNTASLPNKSPILPAVSTDWLETAGTGIADNATAASWNSEWVCFRGTRGRVVKSVSPPESVTKNLSETELMTNRGLVLRFRSEHNPVIEKFALLRLMRTVLVAAPVEPFHRRLPCFLSQPILTPV